MTLQLIAKAKIIGVLKRESATTVRVFNAVSGTSCWSLLVCNRHDENDDCALQFPAELTEEGLGYIAKSTIFQQQAPTFNGARSVFRQAVEEYAEGDNMSGVVRFLR